MDFIRLIDHGNIKNLANYFCNVKLLVETMKSISLLIEMIIEMIWERIYIEPIRYQWSSIKLKEIKIDCANLKKQQVNF